LRAARHEFGAVVDGHSLNLRQAQGEGGGEGGRGRRATFLVLLRLRPFGAARHDSKVVLRRRHLFRATHEKVDVLLGQVSHVVAESCYSSRQRR
jgi:hypothetical protein